MELDQHDSTRILHADREGGVGHGALHEPVYRNIAYHYGRCAEIEEVFQGRRPGYTYGRQANPTLTALERKLTMLEQGVETAVFSTGMAAIGAMMFSLLRAGDHVVASSFLFGNTRSLFESFGRFGIDLDFVDATDVTHVEARLNDRTRLVHVESIANPRTQVADLEAIGRLCAQRGILFVVDNTMTSPALFRPRDVGASLVVNSLSKYLAGHGACLGGSLTDTGLFDWDGFQNLLDPYRQSSARSRGLLQVRKKGLRDMGGTLSPDSANLVALGMETLSMRMERISANALAVARFLEAHPCVECVHYPGLESHAQHRIAARLFASGSGLMSCELAEGVDLHRFIDALQCFACSSNLGDSRSLVIPVATTIFHELGPAKRREMGISERLIRISVGVEAAGDLARDLDRALRQA
jgi:O-acetylhomoserine (thiol)-lyase